MDVGAQRWVQHYPFPPGVDNTTGELIMQAIGHEVARGARAAGAVAAELVYDAQAAEALTRKAPEKVKHPLRRALVESVRRSDAECWWVRSHRPRPETGWDEARRWEGNGGADEVEGEAAKMSARGVVAPLPLAVRNVHVVRT